MQCANGKVDSSSSYNYTARAEAEEGKYTVTGIPMDLVPTCKTCLYKCVPSMYTKEEEETAFAFPSSN